MKLKQLLENVPVLGGQYDPEMEISSISCDSRTLEAGALYVALVGEKDDGHRHIKTAIARGAVAVVCARGSGNNRVRVRDTRLALAQISASWFGHPAEQLTLVGVTGTNGKTTTTHLLKAVLERVCGARVGLIGTNHILMAETELPTQHTTPESYEIQRLLRLMVDEGCSTVVMEVSSHALVQQRTAGMTFDVGIFTNLTQEHLDYHHTMEDYRAAKGKLFDQCRVAVLNLDDEAGRWYQSRVTCPTITYSECRDEADLTARDLRLCHSHIEFQAVAKGQISRIHLPIPGGFTVYNALATLGGCLALDIPLEDCAQPLRTVRGVKGRIEVVPVPRPYTVIIDYAHTPNALENILMTARGFTAGRLFCLFGCGGDRDRTKRPVMGAVAAELADVVVVTSDNPRTEPTGKIIDDILCGMEDFRPAVHVEPDRRAAIYWALDTARLGDVIVLAGKGHETYQAVGEGKIHMDEREIVRDFYTLAANWQEKMVEKSILV